MQQYMAELCGDCIRAAGGVPCTPENVPGNKASLKQRMEPLYIMETPVYILQQIKGKILGLKQKLMAVPVSLLPVVNLQGGARGAAKPQNFARLLTVVCNFVPV